MSGWRDIKRATGRVVHRTMGIPALYLPRTGMTPVAVNVRLHTKFAAREVDGVGAGNAAMLDTTPRIVFRIADLPGGAVITNAVVSVEPGEAYRLGASRPPDGEFITVEVTQLSPQQAAGLPVPA